MLLSWINRPIPVPLKRMQSVLISNDEGPEGKGPEIPSSPGPTGVRWVPGRFGATVSGPFRRPEEQSDVPCGSSALLLLRVFEATQ